MLYYFISLGPYQWGGLVFGILYILFSVRNQPICWVFGILSCICFFVEDIWKTKLYQDAILQVFYIIMGFIGIYQWRKGGQDQEGLKIQIASIQKHMQFIGIGLILGLGVGFIFRNWSNAAYPLWDGITTSFSVIATILLAYRYLGNWIYWIVIDFCYIFLYYDRDAPLFSLLFLVYAIMAIIGFINWRRLYSLSKIH